MPHCNPAAPLPHFNVANGSPLNALKEDIRYLDIPRVIESTLAAIAAKPADSIDDLFHTDSLSRSQARRFKKRALTSLAMSF